MPAEIVTNTNTHLASPAVGEIAHQARSQSEEWHYTKISVPEATVLVGFATCIVTVLGWVRVNVLTLRREREARAHADQNAREDRLRLFEGFLVEKEHLTETTDTGEIHNAYFKPAGLLNSGQFRAEATKIRRDVPAAKRDEFNRLSADLGWLPPEHLKGDAAGTSRDKMASV